MQSHHSHLTHNKPHSNWKVELTLPWYNREDGHGPEESGYSNDAWAAGISLRRPTEPGFFDDKRYQIFGDRGDADIAGINQGQVVLWWSCCWL